MLKPKINPDAGKLIDEAFSSLSEKNQNICYKLRKLVHKAVPDVIEDWKWGPNFNCNGMLCGIWGFQKHTTLTFFNGRLLKDPYNLLETGTGSKNNRNMKFCDFEDINDDVITEYLIEAADNNRKGIKSEIKDIVIPDYFQEALVAAGCIEIFLSTNYTNRKEYILWLEGAKHQETRNRRLKQAISQISCGRKFGA